MNSLHKQPQSGLTNSKRVTTRPDPNEVKGKKTYPDFRKKHHQHSPTDTKVVITRSTTVSEGIDSSVMDLRSLYRSGQLMNFREWCDKFADVMDKLGK